ncbi:MAG: ribonuclease H-like domain-containing protein [Planctomycetota bacterium]
MLRRSFQHLPGIRQRAERKLWDSGIHNLQQLRGYKPARANSSEFERALSESEAALEANDIAYFGRTVPARESWRIFREVHEHCAFIDIETTGVTRTADSVTCVAVATRRGVRTFIKDRNLEEFPEAIRDVPMIVTFNGNAFDLPFLKQTFGSDIFNHHAHYDVCVALRRIGLGGGLKKIEKQLGVPREPGLEGVDGMFAVLLWKLYKNGDPRALATLERYCAEDVLGLPALAAHAANELLKETPFVNELAPLPVPRRVECYLPYSRMLIEELQLLKQQTE